MQFIECKTDAGEGEKVLVNAANVARLRRGEVRSRQRVMLTEIGASSECQVSSHDNKTDADRALSRLRRTLEGRDP